MYQQRKEKIVATVEARMTSSRLPGKVMRPIAGMPVLEMLISRLKRSIYLDAICLATTTNTDDDPLIEIAERLGVSSFRGSETDVLGRVLGAARSVHADIIVEITADCPFMDPTVVDRGIEEFFTHDVDYVGNTTDLDHLTYPNGLDVQVFPTRVLAEVDMLTKEPIDRTHVSYYIFTHKDRYRCYNFEAEPELYGPDIRITLDEEPDYKALCVIADALYLKDPEFTAQQIVEYVRAHPEVVALNQNVHQKTAEEL